MTFIARRGARLGLALALPLLAACAAPVQRPAPVAATDPEAVFATVRAREDRLVTLRARFAADARRGAERHATDGVLLVKKPDRFRLRMMLPLGLTVFDFVQAGQREQLSLPLQGRVVSGTPPPDLMPMSQADLDEAFLRGPAAFPGTCAAQAVAPGQVAVVCRDRSGDVLRRIDIERATATIIEEVSYDRGRPRLVLRYGDYRRVGDVALPYHIEMLCPGRDLSLAIRIARYEVNPSLPDRLFEPAGPAS
jgi:hypothetical protein